MWHAGGLLEDDAVLNIYTDGSGTTSGLFIGYMANRNADGSILFPPGSPCNSKWQIEVSGGTGKVFVLAKHD